MVWGPVRRRGGEGELDLDMNDAGADLKWGKGSGGDFTWM